MHIISHARNASLNASHASVSSSANAIANQGHCAPRASQRALAHGDLLRPLQVRHICGVRHLGCYGKPMASTLEWQLVDENHPKTMREDPERELAEKLGQPEAAQMVTPKHRTYAAKVPGGFLVETYYIGKSIHGGLTFLPCADGVTPFRFAAKK
jgi:hypothetical protein